MGGVDLNLLARSCVLMVACEHGKTLFAQLMDFLPWSTFARIVARYGGDARVRTLCCAEQYRAMAFAQLTYRESLRDIGVADRRGRVETLSHRFSRAGPTIRLWPTPTRRATGAFTRSSLTV